MTQVADGPVIKVTTETSNLIHAGPTNHQESTIGMKSNGSTDANGPGSKKQQDVPVLTGRRRSLQSAQNVDFRGIEYKEVGWIRYLVYDLISWCLSVMIDCFFREIRPRGAFRLPRSGPVIFVAAPHANQFVDPVVLMNQVKRESNRRIYFLIAAKSYHRRFIGFFSRCQLSIPVARAQDNLKKGTGKISIDLETNSLLVKGKGTKFTQECMVGGLVALPQSLGASEIAEIKSDTELVLRKEFKSNNKIHKLLTEGTSFKRADKVNQKKVYQKVFQNLSRGNCIGIFPEGGSHDRTDLLPLKAGVAIMALGAMENDPDCHVKIVPCGMNYFNAHKFRSRAVIEFGHPIEISRELVEKYQNPETSRASVKELLQTVTDGLKAVTVTCEDYETLMVVQAARRLYAGNFAQYLPLPLVVEMNRRLVLGYQTYKNEEAVIKLKEKILKYNDRLKHLYLPDHHVEDCDETHKLRVLPILILRIIKLSILALLALPGLSLFSPVFICAKHISNQKKIDALANSTVKIQANDVVATWKILIAMGFAPVLYSFYASIGTYYCYTLYLSKFNLVLVWFSLYLCGVVVTYAALLAGEQGMDIFKSLRPLYLSLVSGSSIAELKKMRNHLSEEITYIVNLFGPELFPDDFDLLKKNEAGHRMPEALPDSDDEEERHTQKLRRRRLASKMKEKASKESEDTNDSASGLSLDDKYSSSVSDGISLMNSESSFTDIPMFSDYHLHKNAKDSDIALEAQSYFHLTVSMGTDFDVASHSAYNNNPSLSRSSSNSQIEINFNNSKLEEARRSGASRKNTKLSDKIKSKIRESREKLK